jgi:hypothetical protein
MGFEHNRLHPDRYSHRTREPQRSQRREQTKHPGKAAAEFRKGGQRLQKSGNAGVRWHPRKGFCDFAVTVENERQAGNQSENEQADGDAQRDTQRLKEIDYIHGFVLFDISDILALTRKCASRSESFCKAARLVTPEDRLLKRTCGSFPPLARLRGCAPFLLVLGAAAA